MTLASHCRRVYHPVRLLMLVAVLFGLTSCSVGVSRAPRPRVLHLAAIFPTSGVDGPLGRAVEGGVELAVRRHVRLAKGYRLALTHIDENALSPSELKTVLRQQKVLGAVGPLESASASALLPVLVQQRIATISPVALLPVLPGRQTGAQPTSFFPLAATDDVAGKVAADLAVAPASGAGPVFLVDDGSPSGRTLAAAFAAELARRSGLIAGRRSTTSRDPIGVQRVVSAIIEAHPTLVFYAGDTAAGAALRRTLSQTGAPLLPMLTAGSIADHPGWAAAVGGRAISAHTIGIVPAPDLSTLPRATHVQSGYRRAFPRGTLLPQTAMAYDAAMDEIASMRALLRAGKPVTRGALAAALVGSRYRGITGPLDLARTGSPPRYRFRLYTCDLNGVWHDRGAVTNGSPTIPLAEQR